MNKYYVYVYLDPTIKGNYKYKLQNNEIHKNNPGTFFKLHAGGSMFIQEKK